MTGRPSSKASDRRVATRARCGRRCGPTLPNLCRALRAEPFDPAALDRAVDALRNRGEQRIALGQRLMMERIAQMSPDERRAFADRLDEALSRGPRRDKRDTAGE